MAKFKKGDRVRCSDGFDSESSGPVHGKYYTVLGFVGNGGVILDGLSNYWSPSRFNLAAPATLTTPTEHPALTLAKAEVVRLYEVSERTNSQDAMLCAYEKVLHACGLRYRRTVEFVSIDRQEDAV